MKHWTRSAVSLTFLLAACAAEGGREGGADNLPDRGIAGWERVAPDPERPFVLSAEGDFLGGPSALVVADRLFVYGHRAAADGPSTLFRAEGDLGGQHFSAPESLAISGSEPSIAHVDGTWWLAYRDASNAIAIATSSDGVTFQPIAIQGVSGDRSNPSIVVDGARVHLYLSTGTTLVHTEATRAALAFGPESEVLAPGVGCVDPSGDAEACWDEDAIVEAEVRLARTPTGTPIFRMFYAANSGGFNDLGFAAAYDGVTFTRYPFNPVYTGSFDERSPTSVIADDVYLLFFEEFRSAQLGGIAAAVHVPTAPSDRW